MLRPDTERASLRMESIWMDAENRIIQDIVRRIKKNGHITSMADYQINRLIELGRSREEIESILKSRLDATWPQMFKMYDDIAEWQQLFQLAHDMKMEYITCEPPLTLWDEVEKLSRRYNVKVAVHNHPKPSDYWTPKNLLHKLEGRSKLLGACADVGHWKREGLDHMQCLKQMKGRIVSIHFKDIEAVREGKQWQDDTIWGKGILQVSDMVSLLQQQKFKGYLTIEYENNWYNSVPDIQQCLDYLSTILH